MHWEKMPKIGKYQSLRDSAVSKVLALQAWSNEFDPQVLYNKAGHSSAHLSPLHWGGRDRWKPGKLGGWSA